MFEVRDLLANRSRYYQLRIWDFLDPEKHEAQDEKKYGIPGG